ncbi:adenosylcobinamide-GDP ribazoletransferase [uncultured Thalassospira sp.]|uniref:adenosylcobinamide-GDP ribazoletransferase n=1 Tax=uncultured Thalassospira sp. TaxID=404382 RepID=UPI0030DA0973
MPQNQPSHETRPKNDAAPDSATPQMQAGDEIQDQETAENAGLYDLVCGDFGRALMLLSRVPWVGSINFQPALIARSVWCWPLIGLFLAGIAALPALAIGWLSGNNGLASVFAILAMVILTGALHEDGIADCADGFGGGTTRERKLEIMRDSAIGSYGVVALVLVFATRLFVALQAFEIGIFLSALMISAMFSRLAMPVLMMALPPARSDGLGRSAGRPALIPFLLALFAVVIVTMLLGGPVMMLAGLLALICACLMVGFIAKWQIGGHSGDVLGSAQIIAELFVAIAILSVASRGI